MKMDFFRPEPHDGLGGWLVRSHTTQEGNKERVLVVVEDSVDG